MSALVFDETVAVQKAPLSPEPQQELDAAEKTFARKAEI